MGSSNLSEQPPPQAPRMRPTPPRSAIGGSTGATLSLSGRQSRNWAQRAWRPSRFLALARSHNTSTLALLSLCSSSRRHHHHRHPADRHPKSAENRAIAMAEEYLYGKSGGPASPVAVAPAIFPGRPLLPTGRRACRGRAPAAPPSRHCSAHLALCVMAFCNAAGSF